MKYYPWFSIQTKENNRPTRWRQAHQHWFRYLIAPAPRRADGCTLSLAASWWGHFSAQFSLIQSLSCVWLFETPWTAAHQAPLSITNSRSFPAQLFLNYTKASHSFHSWTSILAQWKWECSSLSHIHLFVSPWTVAHQAPLSIGFSRQEHWSG